MGDTRKHNILFFEHNLTDPKETGPSHAWLIQGGFERDRRGREVCFTFASRTTNKAKEELLVGFLRSCWRLLLYPFWPELYLCGFREIDLYFFNQEAFLRAVGRIFASIGCRENNNVFCIIEIIINTRGQMTNCPLQNALF